jgi:integrase
MPAKVQEVALTSRTARLRLASRTKPYYRRIGSTLHLGYYRPATKGLAGSWIARHYLGNEKYETSTLGTADDRPDVPADGQKVLTFDQAQKNAEQWLRLKTVQKRTAEAGTASPTVRSVVQTYIASRKARHAKTGRDAELRLTHHVHGSPLADIPLLNLTDLDFDRWRRAIRRGGRGQPKTKADSKPLTSATLARLLNDVRAALTAGARKIKAPADLLTTIREGLRAPENPGRTRTKQVLSDADVRKLIEEATAHEGDFGALVLMLAATGARMDQVNRITVADLQPEARRVMIPVSRKGRREKQVTHTAVPVPDDVIERLRPLAIGRAGHEPLLLRWHHRQVPGDKTTGTLPGWERVERRPWSRPADMTRAWRATVSAADLPASLVPYSLRHSSIVRGLRAGLPVRLVAAVHDTSTAMIEQHYGAFIVDATEDLLRRALVPLAPAARAATCRA